MKRPASSLEGKSALVTGGAGFIGAHLVDELLGHGVRVTVLDRIAPQRLPSRPAPEIVTADLRSAEVQALLTDRRFDLLFHLAGNGSVPVSVGEPFQDFEQNLGTLLAVLDALRKARRTDTRLVFVSSAAVYGNPTRLPIHEDDPTVPMSPYGVSKLGGERYAAVYAKLYGLSTTSVRLFSCYGPGQRKLVVYDLLSGLLDNPSEIELLGDGTQARDFIFVRDVARVLVHLAANAPLMGETYNVASGRSHTIGDLVAVACRVLGFAPKIRYSCKTRAGDPDIWVASIDRLQETGFTPQTSLEEGLRETLAWLEAERRVRA